MKSLPNTNTVDIALAKNAKIITGSEMPKFFAGKLKVLGGNPKNSQLVRFGAKRMIGGITVTTVPAVHSNGISGQMIGGELGDMLNAAGLTAYAGPPTGYVLTFSNGLVVYLSGDTGITAEPINEQQDVKVLQQPVRKTDLFHANPRSKQLHKTSKEDRTLRSLPRHAPRSGRVRGQRPTSLRNCRYCSSFS